MAIEAIISDPLWVNDGGSARVIESLRAHVVVAEALAQLLKHITSIHHAIPIVLSVDEYGHAFNEVLVDLPLSQATLNIKDVDGDPLLVRLVLLCGLRLLSLSLVVECPGVVVCGEELSDLMADVLVIKLVHKMTEVNKLHLNLMTELHK